MPKPWEKYGGAPAPAATSGAKPWERYAAPAEPKPDLSGVTGTVRRKVDRVVDVLPGDAATRVLLEQGEDAVRALGHNAMKAFHGGAQAVEHGVGWLADQFLPEHDTQNIAGLISGKRPEPKGIGARVHRYIDDTIAADDAALRENERAYQAQVPDSVGSYAGAGVGTVLPFLGSGGRLGGNAVGNIAGKLGGVIGPGTSKFLGALGYGAGEGAGAAVLSPVHGDDYAAEKASQIKLGAGLGAALPIAGQVIGAARGVPRYLGRFTESGSREAAARQIADEAGNISKVLNPQPSQVPGVRRTLAQESQDAGVARLEDLTRQTSKGRFADVDAANNNARVSALRKFAGDERAIATAEEARDAVASPLRRTAQGGNAVVDTSGMITGIDDAITRLDGRPLVQQALRDLKSELYRPATAAEKAASPNWPDMVPRDDVRTLYNVRKTIGDWLSNSSDKPYKEAARRELLEARDALDESMAQASPEFAQYLDAFRQGSREVNRLQLGRELIEGGAGRSILDPITGNPTLTPASFGKQVGDLDKTAANATGFAKAKAADILRPEDMQTIRAIQDDLNRQAKAYEMGVGRNSPTFGRSDLAAKVGGNIAGKLTFGLADSLDKIADSRVREQLAHLLQNPDAARAAIAKLPPADAAVLRDVLARLSGAASALSTQDRVYAEVVGGNIIPRAQFEREFSR